MFIYAETSKEAFSQIGAACCLPGGICYCFLRRVLSCLLGESPRGKGGKGHPFFLLRSRKSRPILYPPILLIQRYVLRKHQLERLVHHTAFYTQGYCFVIRYKLGNISKINTNPNNHLSVLLSEIIILSRYNIYI